MDQGVDIITIENMPENIFKKPIVINKKLRNYWHHEEEILQAIRYFLTKGRDEIDGVIFLISFEETLFQNHTSNRISDSITDSFFDIFAELITQFSIFISTDSPDVVSKRKLVIPGKKFSEVPSIKLPFLNCAKILTSFITFLFFNRLK